MAIVTALVAVIARVVVVLEQILAGKVAQASFLQFMVRHLFV
jgi:hypothetical protein